MKKRFSWSIHTYLMLLVTLLAIPSILLILYSEMGDRGQVIRDAKRNPQFANIVINTAGQPAAVIGIA